MIALIAAVDKGYGIGYKGDLLFRVPEDLAHFRERTSGQVVIMGRKTADSIGKPLEGRRNAIVSTTAKPQDYPGFKIFESLSDAIDWYSAQEEKDIYLIGGQRIYEEGMQYADTIYLTKFHTRAKKVDTYFPELTEEWKAVERGIVYPKQREVHKISFYTYKKC